MKIYVASNWRNLLQQGVVHMLKAAGHEVDDFHKPAPGNDGFNWREIDSTWQSWTRAEAGFGLDMQALHECDACVLVLPCGRSAHLEFGWAVGAGKKTCVFMPEPNEP